MKRLVSRVRDGKFGCEKSEDKWFIGEVVVENSKKNRSGVRVLFNAPQRTRLTKVSLRARSFRNNKHFSYWDILNVHTFRRALFSESTQTKTWFNLYFSNQMFMTSCAWNCYLNYLTFGFVNIFNRGWGYKRSRIMNVCLGISELLFASLATASEFRLPLIREITILATIK